MSELYPITRKQNGKVHCSIEGCWRKKIARGLCRNHYHRYRKHGDPVAGGTFMGCPQKFIRDVIANPQPSCVFWQFATSRGYAYATWEGRYQSVSRLILTLVEGESTNPGMQAAHKCGNGRLGCVNPLCLYWATIKENCRDKEDHGTITRGEKSGMSKLTERVVLAIRIDERSGVEVAKEHQISTSQVSRIRSRKTWGWLKDA